MRYETAAGGEDGGRGDLADDESFVRDGSSLKTESMKRPTHIPNKSSAASSILQLRDKRGLQQHLTPQNNNLMTSLGNYSSRDDKDIQGTNTAKSE